MRTLAHHVRDHTVDSHARQHHREGRENAKQNHGKPLRGHRIGYDLVECGDAIHRLLAIHRLKHGSDGSRHGDRLAFRSYYVPNIANPEWDENFWRCPTWII